MQLSLIHPCYNEEENIEHTVRASLRWIDQRGIDAEVIIVDDGSSDRSVEIIHRLSVEDERIQLVRHSHNKGYGIAVRSGCDNASKEHIAFMDSDGQFRVEDLDLLIEHIDQYDFVTGRRAKRADSFRRNIFGKILGGLNVILFGIWVRDVNCGMKIFKKSIWPLLRPQYGIEKFFNTEVFLRLKRAGITWKTINVPHYPRLAGSQTGGSFHVIGGMVKELWNLQRKMRYRDRDSVLESQRCDTREEHRTETQKDPVRSH
jgi:glycosyltransferase involved in cell wall biosynthesis